MQKARYLLLGLAAMILYMAIPSRSPSARATREVQSKYFAAEQRVLRAGSGTDDVERFLGDLKQIDTGKLPKDVELAMTKIMVAVEANLHTRRAGGDTNAANERVAEAKRELVTQFDRHRGNAY